MKTQTFRGFEVEAIVLLASGVIPDKLISAICGHSGTSEYEYTRSGYYLTIRAPWLPDMRETLSDPVVIGSSGKYRCGFVGFLGSGEFTLECHTWGEVDIPKEFRDLDVAISSDVLGLKDPGLQR
jgi:hypothetical protein